MGWYGGRTCGCCESDECFCDTGTTPDDVSVTIAGAANDDQCDACTDLNATFLCDTLSQEYPCNFFDTPDITCQEDDYTYTYNTTVQIEVWTGYAPTYDATGALGWHGLVIVTVDKFIGLALLASYQTLAYFRWDSGETDDDFDCSQNRTLSYVSQQHYNGIEVCDFSSATVSVAPNYD